MTVHSGFLKKMNDETVTLSASRLVGLSGLGMRKSQLWDSRHLILDDCVLLPAQPAPEHSPTGNLPNPFPMLSQ